MPRVAPNPKLTRDTGNQLSRNDSRSNGVYRQVKYEHISMQLPTNYCRLSSGQALLSEQRGPVRGRLTQEMTSPSPVDADARATIDSVEQCSKLKFVSVDKVRFLAGCD